MFPSNSIFRSRCNKPKRVTSWRAHLFGNQGCQSLLSIGGDNLQFYPNFALFLTLGGMNLDHDFVQVSKLSEDPKKRSSPKMEHFFPPNSGENQKKKKEKKVLHQKRNTFFARIQVNTYAQMDTRVRLFGRMQMYTIQYSNYWGDTAKLLGGIYPPIPPLVSAPLLAIKGY